MMKAVVLYVSVCLSALLLVACGTTTPRSPITAPQVIKSPNLANLSASSCKSGEVIKASAILKLDKYGTVTDVRGLNVRDKQLASQIIKAFKQAKYTPYLKNGVPIAHHLPVTLSLTCPK